MLQSNSLFEKVVELVQTEQDLRIVFNTLEGSYALCLLANLVHLAYEESSTSLPKLAFPKFNVSFFSYHPSAVIKLSHTFVVAWIYCSFSIGLFSFSHTFIVFLLQLMFT